MGRHGVSKIVQITDCHLFGDADGTLLGINTRDSLNAVLALVKTHSADADLVLVTGDISQDDSIASYDFCQRSLETLGIPFAWLYGNHDEPERLAKTSFASNFPQSLQLGDWQVLLLHSQLSGAIHGELVKDELTRLSNALAAGSERPTLIATHHHPLPVGSEWMDAINLKNGRHLLELLTASHQVKLLIHGHTHQAIETQKVGLTILGTPSTCVQFLPASPDFAADTRQPGYRELILYPDGSFSSQIYRLPPETFLPDRSETGY